MKRPPHTETTLDYVADVNAFVSGLSLFPQVKKAFDTGDASDLSVLTLCTIFFTGIVWIVYGISRKQLPIVISSGLTTTAAGWLLAFVAMH